MSSITLTLSGKSSLLQASYFPPIDLDKNADYVCGLIDFQTFNSIPNVDDLNNKFHYGKYEKSNISSEKIVTTISLPHKIYIIDELCDLLVALFREKNSELRIRFNQETTKFELFCNKTIDFTPENSIGGLFGFDKRKLIGKQLHVSDKKVHIITNKLYINDTSKIFSDPNQNVFYIEEETEEDKFEAKVVTLPTGSYEIEDIYNYLAKSLNSVNLKVQINKNTLKCDIFCDEDIDFRPNNSIGRLLGFSKRVLIRNQLHTSDQLVDIIRINAIRVECDIISGSYINNASSHTIHEFYPTVSNGYKIVEVPKNVIYLLVTVDSIRTLTIKIVDQNNRMVNFRDERITVRIHIKKNNVYL